MLFPLLVSIKVFHTILEFLHPQVLADIETILLKAADSLGSNTNLAVIPQHPAGHGEFEIGECEVAPRSRRASVLPFSIGSFHLPSAGCMSLKAEINYAMKRPTPD